MARNEYRVNPNYFARGEWKKICEQRHVYSMTISYSEKGRTVKTEALRDEDMREPNLLGSDGDAHLQQALLTPD